MTVIVEKIEKRTSQNGRDYTLLYANGEKILVGNEQLAAALKDKQPGDSVSIKTQPGEYGPKAMEIDGVKGGFQRRGGSGGGGRPFSGRTKEDWVHADLEKNTSVLASYVERIWADGLAKPSEQKKTTDILDKMFAIAQGKVAVFFPARK